MCIRDRHETMLPEAALALDAPRFVDGAGDGTEDTERGPDQRQGARHPEANVVLAQGLQLFGDEVQLRRKVAEDERQHRQAIVFVVGDRSQYRDDEEQEGKEREQRVIRDRGRVRDVVAVDQLDQAAPCLLYTSDAADERSSVDLG